MQVVLQPLFSSAGPLWECGRGVCELVLLVVLDVTLILIWTRWVWVGLFLFKEEILGCQMAGSMAFFEKLFIGTCF